MTNRNYLQNKSKINVDNEPYARIINYIKNLVIFSVSKPITPQRLLEEWHKVIESVISSPIKP